MKLPALSARPAQMAAKVNIWQSDEYDSTQLGSPQFSLSSHVLDVLLEMKGVGKKWSPLCSGCCSTPRE
jgi:hypothetical protein